MLSLEERLAMLDKIIENKTPEQLFQELTQFEAVGPQADSFLIEEQTSSYICVTMKTVHVSHVSRIYNNDHCCESPSFYSESPTADLPLAA